MEMEVVTSEQARQLMETLPMAKEATRRGLNSAGAAFLDAVNEGFRTSGHGEWKQLNPYYREEKMMGRVQPGRQLPSTTAGRPDNMLTGALRLAAAYIPRVTRTKGSITLHVRGTVALERTQPKEKRINVNREGQTHKQFRKLVKELTTQKRLGRKLARKARRAIRATGFSLEHKRMMKTISVSKPIPVRTYMKRVMEARPYYRVRSADYQRMAEEFKIGFLNYLYGVPDKVGEDLQAT